MAALPDQSDRRRDWQSIQRKSSDYGNLLKIFGTVQEFDRVLGVPGYAVDGALGSPRSWALG